MTEKPEAKEPLKPHQTEAHSTVDVLREFAHSVYDGAIGDHFKSQKSKDPEETDLTGSMETAQLYGRGTGEVLEAVAAIGIAVGGHGLLKKLGVIGQSVEKASVIERSVGAEKSITGHLLPTQEATENPILHAARQLEKSGALEFKPDSVILKNEHGSFERDFKTGAMLHTAPNGDVYGFPVNGSFKMGPTGDAKQMHKFDAYFVKRSDGSEVVFDGLDQANRATTNHGVPHQWSFSQDGSISMRSDSGGQHTMDIGPNGKGEAVSWFPKAEPKPGEFNEERVGLPVTYDPVTRKAGVYVVPDRTPINSETREQVNRARNFLDQLIQREQN